MTKNAHETISGLLESLTDDSAPAIGAWCQLPSAFTAEMLGAAGFDLLCVDTQHGLIGYDLMVSMLQALGVSGVACAVRVAWNEPSAIMRALDAGASAVIVPMVNSAAEAAAAVGACRYAPDGYRSWGPVRASVLAKRYSVQNSAQRSACIVMVETPQAVELIDEIAAVPGLDGVLVGATDFAIAALHDANTRGRHPDDVKLITEVAQRCIAHGVVPGIAVGGPDDVPFWREIGFKFFFVRSDVSYLTKGAADVLAASRAAKS